MGQVVYDRALRPSDDITRLAILNASDHGAITIGGVPSLLVALNGSIYVMDTLLPSTTTRHHAIVDRAFHTIRDQP